VTRQFVPADVLTKKRPSESMAQMTTMLTKITLVFALAKDHRARGQGD